MLGRLLTKLVGDPNEKTLKSLQPLVDEINALEPEMEARSQEELRELLADVRAEVQDATAPLREEIEEVRATLRQPLETGERISLEERLKELENRRFRAEQEVLNRHLPRVFAAVREAAKRTLGQRHFDVQLMGGIVLHQGKIAEMKTGEGKTLTATLAVTLNALTGRGVHVVTVNDYLAKRDTQWMGQVYHYLGLTVGCIQHDASFLYDPEYVPEGGSPWHSLKPVPRRMAYEADITYGTNNEFGFDYLRDNMAYSLDQVVQRELYYAIVDEVDNILIDEARTPLIISGPAEESEDYYYLFAQLVRRLKPGDYEIDLKTRSVTLTEQGIEKIERWLKIPKGQSLYDERHAHYVPYLDNALKAQFLFHRDKDYIVKGGQVIIVDEFTGRLMPGRRYSEGLHQAIEAKEGVRVRREQATLATITFQNYFRMYRKLAGMTGTAATEAEEFEKIYGLEVVVIPTHKPMIRIDHPDLIYRTREGKFRAVVEEIERAHKIGRPVLVGTTSIEASEHLSKLLRQRKIPHQVLNAKHHEKEASIIAQAGRLGAVTIATNMAGRGTDIILGGNPEGLAWEELKKKYKDPNQAPPEEREAVLEKYRRLCAEEGQKVRELGGLYVIGTERHEARRIDNQLRGRSGRQGDPGESRFFLSTEDELLQRFGSPRIWELVEKMGFGDDQPIEHPMLSKMIEQAQIKGEGYNFDIRKHLVEYDDVMNRQREVIYADRRRILEAENLRPRIWEMIEEEIDELVEAHTDPEEGTLNGEGLGQAVRAFLPLQVTDLTELKGMTDPEEAREFLRKRAEEIYDELERSHGPEQMRALEKQVMLWVIDRHWTEYLTHMEELRQGIGLRAYAQRNPLVEYKREAFNLFDNLRAAIRSDVVYWVYRASLEAVVQRQAERVRRARRVAASSAGGKSQPVRRRKKIGRNDPCPCGSGKKFKKCHGAPGRDPAEVEKFLAQV